VIVEASITGLFRTVLIILGAFVLLRFLGQLMMAKRNMEEERKINERQRAFYKERFEKMKKFGKTTVLNENKVSKKNGLNDSKIEDVDFEVID
jgi:hypothetical protein